MLSQHTLIKKRPDVTNTASISTGIKFKISQVSCRHSSIKENCQKNIITSLLALVGFKLAASLTSREVINFNCTAFLWCKELPTKPHSVASPSYWARPLSLPGCGEEPSSDSRCQLRSGQSWGVSVGYSPTLHPVSVWSHRQPQETSPRCLSLPFTHFPLRKEAAEAAGPHHPFPTAAPRRLTCRLRRQQQQMPPQLRPARPGRPYRLLKASPPSAGDADTPHRRAPSAEKSWRRLATARQGGAIHRKAGGSWGYWWRGGGRSLAARGSVAATAHAQCRASRKAFWGV